MAAYGRALADNTSVTVVTLERRVVGDAGLMRRIYCEEVLDTGAGEAALDELAALAAAGPTCLLCFERDPERCHRRVLSERLAGRGFDIVDLFA